MLGGFCGGRGYDGMTAVIRMKPRVGRGVGGRQIPAVLIFYFFWNLVKFMLIPAYLVVGTLACRYS